jgi:hypothetical protein
VGSNSQQNYAPNSGFNIGAITRQGAIPAVINALVNGYNVKKFAQGVNSGLPANRQIQTQQYGPFAFNYDNDIQNIQQAAAAQRQQAVLEEMNQLMGSQYTNPAVAGEQYKNIFVPQQVKYNEATIAGAGAQDALNAMNLTPEMLSGPSQAPPPPPMPPIDITKFNTDKVMTNNPTGMPVKYGNLVNDPFTQNYTPPAPKTVASQGQPLAAGTSVQGGPFLASTQDLERIAGIIPTNRNKNAQTNLYGAQTRYNDAGVGYRQAQTETENYMRPLKGALTKAQTEDESASAFRRRNPVFAPPGPNRQIQFYEYLQKNPQAAILANKGSARPINLSKEQLTLLKKDPTKLNALEKQAVRNITLRIAANSRAIEAQGVQTQDDAVNQDYLDSLGLGEE